MRIRIRRTAVPYLVLVFASAAGCGPGRAPVAPVEGVVTLSGKPLPKLRVQFMPDANKGTHGPTSTGITDDKGRFKLTCADGRVGAVVGWHKVVINDMQVRLPIAPRHGTGEEDKSKTGNADDRVQRPTYQPPRVPDPYTTSGRTPLSQEVKPGNQEVTIELAR